MDSNTGEELSQKNDFKGSSEGEVKSPQVKDSPLLSNEVSSVKVEMKQVSPIPGAGDDISDISSAPSSIKKTPAKKKSTGGASQIKATSISSKVPSFLSRTSKGNVTYFTMVHEAIVELGDRTGSSVPAIQKFMKNRHPELLTTKPKQFHLSCTTAIKAGLKEGKLIKIKASYKINREWVQKETAAHRAKEAKKKALEKKKKKALADEKKKKEAAEKEKKKKMAAAANVAKPKTVTPLTEEDIAKIEQKKLDKELEERKKAAAAKLAKEREERIKKRRFPMDDLKLISEDKELGVKRPSEIARPPFLPFALQSLLPHDERSTTKKSTPGSVVTACSTTMSSGSCGLFSDVLQVYQFFVGDFGYAQIFEGTVPNFTLKQLLYAVNEVSIGNTRKACVVPPLISHLFMTALSALTSPKADDWVSEDDSDHTKWESLKSNLSKINKSLCETSWGEILICYMNVMETFFTSDASTTPNALPGYPVSMEMVSDDEDAEMESQEESESGLPSGYGSYVGPVGCALHRGYSKLLRHDPWHLHADELIAALRALTDDILAMKPALAREVSERDEKLFELLKKKKAAESQYRKIRLAYEGPKWPRGKGKKPNDDKEKDENGNLKDGQEVQEVFKPTATKDQFEAATKSRDKAIEQYDKGMKNLVHRSQPIGFDRNHNAVYYFHHAPESLYVETTRKQADSFDEIKSWHCIDSKPLFEKFTSSLDIRGIREKNLHDELAGTSLKRHLYDSNRKANLISAHERQLADLERRLDIAMIANAESTRRSGRLANTSKDEVSRIREEIEQAKLDHEAQLFALETIDDYSTLTGIKLLSDFEHYFGIYSRCSHLWTDDESKSGIIGKIAKDLLELEGKCYALAAWKHDKKSRDEWMKSIEDTTKAWQNGCTLNLGPKGKDSDSSKASSSPTKRQRMSLDPNSSETRKGPSISFDHVLSVFRGPLIDIEKRVYSITGLERATQEVDEANENMSVVSDGTDDGKAEIERRERLNYAWKKKIYSLHSILPRRAGAVRDVIISAIAIARKGNFADVLDDLRDALKIHRPGAGGRARTAALSLLEKYGFILEDDDDMSDGGESLSEIGSSQDAADDEVQGTSFLSTNAMVLSGSLEGDDNADRVDWKDAVLTCKTVSRFSALLTALKSRASPRLDKLIKDKKALSKAISHWEASSKTRKKTKKNNASSKKFSSATEIWADVTTTDNFVMCKVKGYPWWPARKCIASDADIASALEAVNRSLVSFVGEQHLYVVEKDTELKPFNGHVEEDMTGYTGEVVKNVKNSFTMARRIMHGRGLSTREILTGKSVDGAPYVEEKKTSS